jgi:hypothetical protein
MAKEAGEEKKKREGMRRDIYTLGEVVRQWMSQNGEDVKYCKLEDEMDAYLL